MTLTRRRMLALTGKAGAALALLPLGCAPSGREESPVWVNDVHSGLNRTRVARVERPVSAEQVADIIRAARSDGLAVSVAGARHAMGGQQFGTDTILIDTAGLDSIGPLDADRGIIEAGAGVAWPALMDRLASMQEGTPAPQWGIRQKQTGADRLTLGGALAANIHGRGLALRPIVEDIESFTLANASGELVECSRSANADLFRLAIGGYGLFGPMVSVRLRLAPRRRIERVVEVVDSKDLPARFQDRIDSGYLFGDYQFATDAGGDLLRKGVFSCYRPVEDDTPESASDVRLDERMWLSLILLGHVDRALAFEKYAAHYLATNGQRYWSDTHQLSLYLQDYHRTLGASLKDQARGTEMISEIYVPRESLPAFMEKVRADIIEHGVNVVYGTIRLIEKDEETFLAWAREPFACIIFNLHVEHDDAGLAKARTDFRRLIDRGIEMGGSYYLTYHRWATRDQVLACYPQMPGFLRRKKEFDPDERFASDWYRHHRDLLPA